MNAEPIAFYQLHYDERIDHLVCFTKQHSSYHASGFRKTQCPKHIGDCTIRPLFLAAFRQPPTSLMRLILPTTPLMFQSVPDQQTETRVAAA